MPLSSSSNPCKSPFFLITTTAVEELSKLILVYNKLLHNYCCGI